MWPWFFAWLILCLLTPSPALSAVKLNELSSYASSGDWVELWADTETDLLGWYLQDDTGGIIKKFAGSEKIGTPSAALTVVQVSNRLNRDRDVIELYNAEGLLVDSMSYGYEDALCAPAEGGSLGRQPGTSPAWVRWLASTPLLPNGGDLLPCPSPSPSPVPSPTPSPTPNASTSPSPSPSPNPSPTPKPPSPSPQPSRLTPMPSADTAIGTVAGETAVDLSAFGVSPAPSAASPSPAGGSLSLNRGHAQSALGVGGGLIILSGTGILGLRKFRGSRPASDEL